LLDQANLLKLSPTEENVSPPPSPPPGPLGAGISGNGYNPV